MIQQTSGFDLIRIESTRMPKELYINDGDQMERITVLHNGVITVGTTPVRLPDNPDAKFIQFMHDHESAKVYIGGSNVTVENGFSALAVEDTTERYPVQNTNVFYAVSDTPNVSLRYIWGDWR